MQTAEHEDAQLEDIQANEDGVALTPFVNVAEVLPRNPLEDLTLELHRVVCAVRDSESAKPVGEVTLSVKVQRSSNVVGAVVISADVKAKLPKEAAAGGRGLLFVDSDGVLSTRNPNQRDFFERPRGV